MGGTPTSKGLNMRSLVRIKVLLLWLTFTACWLTLRFNDLSEGYGNAVLGIAAVAAVLFYFVRCEQCHTSVMTGRSNKLPLPSMNALFPPKRCPACGKERF
jgi:hypothetical protein